VSAEALGGVANWRHVRPFAVEGLAVLDWIDPQLPWWVTGPGVGLCVVALYGLINARVGVSGAWLATIAPAEGWPPDPWRRTFLLALVGGRSSRP
jgi:hypothetical protein